MHYLHTCKHQHKIFKSSNSYINYSYLYCVQDISHNLMITAMNGKRLPAITVFTKALQYMRKIVLEDLDKQVSNTFRSILWILTVPAIWSHPARHVMRIAAMEVKLLCSSLIVTFRADNV